MKYAAKTITRDPAVLGPAVHPGEMLLEEYLKPLGLTQAVLEGLSFRDVLVKAVRPDDAPGGEG